MRLGGDNARAIEQSQVVVAVLDGPDVDSGTASEVGYAAALGKGSLATAATFA
jgi:nucleoside 2-deoxyribosyltransferase